MTDYIKRNAKTIIIAVVVLLVAHEGYHLWF
jgi:predicted negative regulator of RcsB-dependent stress response